MKELFGQRLREQRLKHHLTLEQVAEKADLSANYIGMDYIVGLIDRTRIRVAGIALPETRRHGGAPSRLLRRVSPAPVVADTHNFDGCLTKRGIHGSVILSVSGCIVLDRYAAHARDVNPCQGAVVPEAAVSFLPYRWPHRVRADQP